MVYALSYVYKPSWYGPLQDKLTERYERVVRHRYEAWDGFEVPACAAVLFGKETVVSVGDQVLTWKTHDSTCPLSERFLPLFEPRPACACTPRPREMLSVMDEPDWGRADTVGEVAKVLGSAEIKQKSCEHGFAFASTCQRCGRYVRGA